MKVVYPGSFDPITYGHMDIITRGLKLFGSLVVAVLDNPTKKTVFTALERKELIIRATDAVNIEVDVFSGLLSDYTKKIGADLILRGLRNGGDFETEYRYAAFNKNLSLGTETLYLPSSPEFTYISSGIVKEAAKLVYENNLSDRAINDWVPAVCLEAMKQKFSKG